VQAPECVTQDFVFNALGFSTFAFNRDAGTGRCEDFEAIRRTNLVNAEEMSGVADDNDTLQVVGARNDREAMNRLVRTRALGFGNDVGFGNADTLEVLCADSTL
jgi:hypothetical protein